MIKNATQPVAVVVNQSYPASGTVTRGQSYSGVQVSGAQPGTATVILPDLRNFPPNELDWISSVNVINLGTSPTRVRLETPGNGPCLNPNDPWVYPNDYQLFYVPQCYYWQPSFRSEAKVTSLDGAPIAVIVNHASNSQTNVDLAHSYNGFNR